MLAGVTHRPLAIRKRPDLVTAVERVKGHPIWRVKDPIALEYFEFNEHEYAIFDMLDGRVTPAQVRAAFERQFAPLELSLSQLQRYLADLFQAGLVVTAAPGQGGRLLERRREVRRREAWQAVFNVLAFRVRGVDPQPLLNWLEPRTRWLFSPLLLALCSTAVFAAAALIAVQFDQFRLRLPSMRDFLTPAQMMWMALAVMTAKLLHEMAHALTCRRFGGECHELGIMFLVFTPCLYCNVSDAWLLTDRWSRIAISAAGILVELVIAAVCVFLWWFSQPGLFNSMCLNMMIVCSISTFVFNGNPLLRYDGYFVLSDLVREANLGQKSSDFLWRLIEEWFLAIPWRDQSWRAARRPLLLATYGMLSFAYRIFVLVSILWLCYAFFNERQLPAVGRIIVFLAVAGTLFRPVAAGLAFLRDPLRRKQVDRRRAGWVTAVLGAAILAAFLIPLPRRIPADVVLEAHVVPRVYVAVPGRLTSSIAEGNRVRRGDVLIRLENPPLEQEIERLAGEQKQADVHLHEIESRRSNEPAAAALLPAAREALENLTRQLSQKRRDAERLVIRSPSDGVVLPAPTRLRRSTPRGALPKWTGTPLDESNSRSWLETGTLICQVGDPELIEPVLVINQGDVDLVQPGQRVRIRIDQRPAAVLSGTVIEVAAIKMEAISRDLAAVRNLATRADATGVVRPLETSYQARVELDDHAFRLLMRGSGRALVTTDPASLAARVFRSLRRVFHFKV